MSLGLILLMATLLDAVVGEPPMALHPVVWMGNVINAAKKSLPRTTSVTAFVSGLFLAISLPVILGLGTAFGLQALEPWPILQSVVSTWLLWSAFALRLLWKAVERVKSALISKDLPSARSGLSWLCSRSSDGLSSEEVGAAAIESAAENLSDSLVAPLFYFAILGVPGAIAYRAVNTMDAMIGYHGEMEYFGKAAARLDDVLNYFPARLTSLILLIAGYLLRLDVKMGWLICRRDCRQTESPNAGYPMATMAGLLGVQLSKKDAYSLGNASHKIRPTDLTAAQNLLLVSALLTVILTFISVKPWMML